MTTAIGGGFLSFIKFSGLVMVAMVGIICLSCNGKKANASESSGGGAGEALLANISKELAEHGAQLWEKGVTETTADKAPGYLNRGKSNLKITGVVTFDDLVAINNSAVQLYNTNNHQLVKLDFSDASFQLGDQRFPRLTIAVGSLTLPRGLKTIDWRYNSNDTIMLLEFNLPSVDSGIESLWVIGAFAQIIIAPDIKEIVGVKSSNNFSAVIYEGRDSIDISAFGPSGNIWGWRNQASRFVFAFPSTLTEFTGSADGCEEMYCYSKTPPLAGDGGKNQFQNVKTIYVPAGSEKVYEEAWFNYTGAEFKPLPKNMTTIDSFIKNWRPAKNNLGISVERKDKE
jgi:hypothetical protein